MKFKEFWKANKNNFKGLIGAGLIGMFSYACVKVYGEKRRYEGMDEAEDNIIKQFRGDADEITLYSKSSGFYRLRRGFDEHGEKVVENE